MFDNYRDVFRAFGWWEVEVGLWWDMLYLIGLGHPHPDLESRLAIELGRAKGPMVRNCESFRFLNI